MGPSSDNPTRRLRIAVLNRVFSPTGGGAERYSIALVEQLAQRHEIHVFAQQINHKWPGVTYHTVSSPLKKSRWMNQLWYANATKRATQHGFDVVQSHENCWSGQVQTVHVLPTHYKLFHGVSGGQRLMRWLKVWTSPRLMTYIRLERARFAPMHNRCIVATSKTLMSQMASAFPDSASLLQVLTPGVTLPAAPSTPVARLAARQRLGLPAGGNGLLFIGNDYAKKGLDTLLAAMAKLDADTWLAVVGNAVHIPEYRDHAKAAGIEARVHFLGALNDINDAYLAADCLVHPTLEDTFAMVVMEAMSHGLPVVLSGEKYCGISSMLANESNALILKDPRDTTELCTALNRVLKDQSLRQKLSAAALEFASAHQWSAVALQQEQIYFAVTGDRCA
ncbi:MAG: glycosyltransferase family 4 protein [Planctomycetes bacterium]|nr:glycosyltransferase family 4 protein [Planctomycetota bacterium]